MFFKPPSKIVQNLARLAGTVVLGYLYQDEIAELNRALYSEGLIDADRYVNNSLNMYTFGGLGAAATLEGVVLDVENELTSKGGTAGKERFEQINNLWIHRDKLDEGGWGLRIIDTKSHEEIYQIKLSQNKNFNYLIDQQNGILISEKGNEIWFRELY